MEQPESKAVSSESLPEGEFEARPDPIDTLLDRVTRRLAVDRELQLEVRQELRSHVEESMAEFRAAGRDEHDARDDALRALGDEADLTEQLWHANRRRVRLRAAAAWAVRLLLPPAALALVALLAFSGLTAYLVLFSSRTGNQIPFEGEMVERAEAAVLENAPPDVRLLLEQTYASGPDRLGYAKRAAESFPDDPALYANYATTAVATRPLVAVEYRQVERDPAGYSRDDNALPVTRTEEVRTVDEAAVAEVLAILAEGERREPDNALFPLLTASALYEVAATTKEGAPPRQVLRPGSRDEQNWPSLDVRDAARLAQARAALARAAGKPYLRSYTADLVRRRINVIPARRLSDLSLRARVQNVGRAGWGNVANAATGWAVYQAMEAALAGRAEEAQRIVADNRAIARLAMADAEGFVDVMDAHWIHTATFDTEARVRQALGDEAGAQALWTRYDAAMKRAGSLRDSRYGHADSEQSSFVYVGTEMWLKPGSVDFAPVRRAESAAFDQLGIAFVSACLLALSVLYALVACLRWMFVPRASLAPRLFIGWRRLAGVVAMGAVLPVALYLAYAWLTPLGGRGQGMGTTHIRSAIEYAVVGAVVLVAVSELARRAVLARMAELRLPPPRFQLGWIARIVSGWNKPARAAMGAAALTMLAAWGLPAALVAYVVYPGAPHGVWVTEFLIAGAVIAGLLVAFALGVRFGGYWRTRDATGRADKPRPVYGWLARAVFPAIVSAAVVLGLLGLPFRWVETRAVAAAAADGQPLTYLGTAERSIVSELKHDVLSQPPWAATQPPR